MHIHIGCTYLTFLHCAFSNVSSNRLPEKIQSRIALWVKASSGVKKGPKNVKSRPLFLIHQTHQVIFAALFELVMVHILHRKKLDDVGAEYLTKIAGNVQKR